MLSKTQKKIESLFLLTQKMHKKNSQSMQCSQSHSRPSMNALFALQMMRVKSQLQATTMAIAIHINRHTEELRKGKTSLLAGMSSLFHLHNFFNASMIVPIIM